MGLSPPPLNNVPYRKALFREELKVFSKRLLCSVPDCLFVKQVFCKVDTGSCSILVPTCLDAKLSQDIKSNKIAFISDRLHVEASTMTIKTASKLHFFAAGSHDYPFPPPATKSSKTSLPKLRKGKGQFMIRITVRKKY